MQGTIRSVSSISDEIGSVYVCGGFDARDKDFTTRR